MSVPSTPFWTILRVLRWTTKYFQEKAVSEPRASAEILLAHVLGLSRLDLYLRHDQPLTPDELAHYKELIRRRRRGEPVAYITGHKEFWSLDFLVTPATLIPRPETEVLVEAVLEVFRERDLKPPIPPYASPPSLALDLGAGSGAVVVALAKELPELTWVAVDLSEAALQIARLNARRHLVAERVHFFRGDLLTGLKAAPRFALIVANLPYVSQREWEALPPDIRDYEPPEALLGGPDGLALLRPAASQAHHYLCPGGWLALEVGAGQAGEVSAFLKDTGAYDSLHTLPDYQGIPRVVRARRRASPPG
uniref:Release factor glutamine methyltransferase n=1 Tax=Desulfobacca acetoxidans TaxID=60893 RepID=A0A7C5EQV6_9BACT